MKKHLFTTVLLLILAAALMLSFTACANEDDRVAQLQQENAQLQRQLEALSQQLEALGQGVGLSDWSMQATAWSTGDGATVSISASPLHHEEGQTAAFQVTLEGEVVADIPCTYNDSVYTASAELNAADGYCYYIRLIAPDGAVTEVAVNTPTMPTDDSLINLYSCLNAFCSVYLEDCQTSQDTLTLVGGYGQIQLPRIPLAGGSVTCTDARLSLQCNGAEIHSQTLQLPPMDETNSAFVDLDGIQLPLPQMQEEDQLDLWLEVTCSDGEVLRCYAGSWFFIAGQLGMAVG